MPPASMRVEAPWPNSGVGEDHGRRDWRWASPRRGIARGNKVPQEEFQWVPWRLVNVGTRGNSTSNSCSRTLFGYKSEVLCLDLETKMRCKNAGLLLHLLHCCSIAALLLLGCVFVRPRTIGKLSHRLEHRGSSPTTALDNKTLGARSCGHVCISKLPLYPVCCKRRLLVHNLADMEAEDMRRGIQRWRTESRREAPPWPKPVAFVP